MNDVFLTITQQQTRRAFEKKNRFWKINWFVREHYGWRGEGETNTRNIFYFFFVCLFFCVVAFPFQKSIFEGQNNTTIYFFFALFPLAEGFLVHSQMRPPFFAVHYYLDAKKYLVVPHIKSNEQFYWRWLQRNLNFCFLLESFFSGEGEGGGKRRERRLWNRTKESRYILCKTGRKKLRRRTGRLITNKKRTKATPLFLFHTFQFIFLF